jgi:oligoribonuclease NrnB/cAMP/cGMP phosphodiesterase (DHH superfamily)
MSGESKITQKIESTQEAYYNCEVVYFHSGCMDGFAAAYIYNLFNKHKKLRFEPIAAGQETKYAEDVDLVFLDVAPHVAQLDNLMSNRYGNILLIDHHQKTAETFIDALANKYANKIGTKITIVFSITRCASVLTLEYLSARPRTIKEINAPVVEGTYIYGAQLCTEFIEDRDLWTWKLENSKEVSAYLFHVLRLPNKHEYMAQAFEKFDIIIEAFAYSFGAPQKYIDGGSLLLENNEKLYKQIAGTHKICTLTTSSGKTYRVAHVQTRLFRSEVGNYLLELHKDAIDCSVCWHYDVEADKFWLSFRSDDTHVDTNAICSEFGGGGHRNAAGCEIKGAFSQYFTW